MSDIPKDFSPLVRSSPFLDLLGPVYSKREKGILVLGLRIEKKHCNTRGFAHGGLLATLADAGLGSGVAFSREPPIPLVTASLTTDFAGSAQIGDWVEARIEIQKSGRRLAFANAYLSVDGKRIVRASAVFSVTNVLHPSMGGAE